eukprot:Rhum_TRINITY_DN14236_c0_g1::Rhum_TRINITY_DN14236_c0_g1_i2::g.74664::m.74664
MQGVEAAGVCGVSTRWLTSSVRSTATQESTHSFSADGQWSWNFTPAVSASFLHAVSFSSVALLPQHVAVFSSTSGLTGASYGASKPVIPLILPSLCSLYSPFGSRFATSSVGASTYTSMNGSFRARCSSRASLRSFTYGEISDTIASVPESAISAATSDARRTASCRSSAVSVRSRDSPKRRLSPSSRYTCTRSSFTRRRSSSLPIVDLPDPDSPVIHSVAPRCPSASWRSSGLTASNLSLTNLPFTAVSCFDRSCPSEGHGSAGVAGEVWAEVGLTATVPGVLVPPREIQTNPAVSATAMYGHGFFVCSPRNMTAQSTHLLLCCFGRWYKKM